MPTQVQLQPMDVVRIGPEKDKSVPVLDVHGPSSEPHTNGQPEETHEEREGKEKTKEPASSSSGNSSHGKAVTGKVPRTAEEQARLTMLSKSLQTRLRYAKLKVDRGWVQHSIDHIESHSLHRHDSRLAVMIHPPAFSSSPFASFGSSSQFSKSLTTTPYHHHQQHHQPSADQNEGGIPNLYSLHYSDKFPSDSALPGAPPRKKRRRDRDRDSTRSPSPLLPPQQQQTLPPKYAKQAYHYRDGKNESLREGDREKERDNKDKEPDRDRHGGAWETEATTAIKRKHSTPTPLPPPPPPAPFDHHPQSQAPTAPSSTHPIERSHSRGSIKTSTGGNALERHHSVGSTGRMLPPQYLPRRHSADASVFAGSSGSSKQPHHQPHPLSSSITAKDAEDAIALLALAASRARHSEPSMDTPPPPSSSSPSPPASVPPSSSSTHQSRSCSHHHQQQHQQDTNCTPPQHDNININVAPPTPSPTSTSTSSTPEPSPCTTTTNTNANMNTSSLRTPVVTPPAHPTASSYDDFFRLHSLANVARGQYASAHGAATTRSSS